MKILIIDGNSLGYANQNGAKLTVGKFETQAIFGFLKSLHAMLSQHRGWKVLVLWDGHAQWRFDLYPRYKADRDADPVQALMREKYKEAKPILQKALQYLGIAQITALDAEADDLAGYFVRTIDKSSEIKLVSGDQDWLQLVRENVSWYDPIRDVSVTIKNFMDFTGYENPRAFLEGKVLHGDTSDKVNGVGGIGKGKAPLFLAEYKSFDNFIAMCDAGNIPKSKVYQRLYYGTETISLEEHLALLPDTATDEEREEHKKKWKGDGRAIFARNMKLMNLLDAPKPTEGQIVKPTPKLDEEKFRAICERLNFASILRGFTDFIGVFKGI